MTVTIKDIAAIAGVSHTTVSRALRGHPGIARATSARIRQIAAELGYVPNTVARGLKTRRSQVLGVIVRRIDDPFFAEVLQGIEEVLHEAGYSLFLAASQRDAGRERAIIRVMAERRVEGVIVSSTRLQPRHVRQLDQFQVPLVLINNQALDEPDVHSVYHDDAYGSCQLARHLLALGHRRIVYLGNQRGGKTDADRRRGYRQALDQAGQPWDPTWEIGAPNGQPEGGAAGMRQILTGTLCPTALLCYNDLMAIGAMQAARQSGLRIPDDLAVTGFDNIELAAYVSPPLTTFHQPKHELGREAALMMLRALLGDQPPAPAPEVLVLRGELVPRQSTAPPRAA